MSRIPRRSRRLSRPFLLAALCLTALAAWPAASLGDPAEGDSPANPDAEHRYIVVLENSVNHPGRVAQRHAVNRDAELSHVYNTGIEGYAAEMSPADMQAVSKDPAVAYVERDMPVEPLSQETPTGVRRIFAASNSTIDIDEVNDVQINVDVAVIDSGIDFDHPDLRVVARTNCHGPNVIKPGAGEPEEPAPHACIDNQGDDQLGHGTHVAGIIGAVDNNFGVVGVAPGARLWSVRVLGKETSEDPSWISEVVAGINWVTDHSGQIEVANMSLGCAVEAGEESCINNSSALKAALSASISAGVVYVVAAGNDTHDISGFDGPTESYEHYIPADLPDVITVSSLADFDGLPGALGSHTCDSKLSPIVNDKGSYYDVDDSLANSSNWGANVDMIAPGACIRSTYKNGGYQVLSGTSMAAPHVTGAAAILASINNPGNYGDVLTIKANLATQGNKNWTDTRVVFDKNFYPSWVTSDAYQEPLLDLSNSSVFKVTHPGNLSSIGAVSDETYDLDVFARGADGKVWRKAYRDTLWGNWSNFSLNAGESIIGAPAMISRRDGSTDLFAKNNYGAIVFRNKWQETWSSWYPIYPPDNKAILDSPAATARPDIYDGLTLVVRGHDGNIYLKNHYASIPGEWSPWENLGSPAPGTASSPAITMHAKEFLHLAVRGQDGAIWTKAWSNKTLQWSGWVNLGYGFTSAPALAASRSGDEMFLFARKEDNRLWMRKAVKGELGWSAWEKLGEGYVASDPTATSRESHGVSVFITRSDQRVYEKRFLYGGWTEWMSIDDGCPPGKCDWHSGGAGTGQALASVETNDLTAVSAERDAAVYPSTEEGLDLEDPTLSLQGELDSALLDGKGHYMIDVGDVDADESSDLVTVKDDGEVMVALGNEVGTFAEPLDTGIDLPPVMNGAGNHEPIALGDVDGDGFDDFVVFTGPGSGKLAVYKGQLDGKFATTAITSLSGSVNSALRDGAGQYFLDLADVNGDERADLVAISSSGSLISFKGQSSGQFAAATTTSGFTVSPVMTDGAGHEPVGVGDVNGDRLADLLTLDASGALKLYKGKTDATFTAATTPYAGTINSSLRDGTGQELAGLLDYDHDGLSDLVSISDQGVVSVYGANSNGTFDSPVTQAGSLKTVRQSASGEEIVTEKPLSRRARVEMPVAAGVAAVSPAASQLDVYMRTSANQLASSRWTTGWSWWLPVSALPGGVALSDPAVSARGSGVRDLFVRGSGDAIWHTSYDPTAEWAAWESIGGPSAGKTDAAPASVSMNPGTVHVYARGGGNVHQKWWSPGTGWSAWASIGAPAGGATSAAAATSIAAGTVHVYVRGGNNEIYQKFYSAGTNWLGWDSIGGPPGGASSAPAAVTRAASTLDIFVRGSDNALWHKPYTPGGGWGAWHSLGGTLVSAPSAASGWAGTVHVYAVHSDGKVWQRWYADASGWSSWEKMS
jgi:subtilisin family serine protease